MISVGDERRDIVRTNIVLAAQAGAVHVVSTTHQDVLDELESVVVTEHIAPTMQAAVHEAAIAIDTDAVLLLLGRRVSDRCFVRARRRSARR